MARTKRNAKQVADAIRKAGGVKTEAARILGISRTTLDGYIERWNDVGEAYAEASDVSLDAAEAVLMGYVKGERSVTDDATGERQTLPIDSRLQLDAAKFFLRTKGRARGYGDKIEHSGSLNVAVSELTDAELAQVAAGEVPKRLQ